MMQVKDLLVLFCRELLFFTIFENIFILILWKILEILVKCDNNILYRIIQKRYSCWNNDLFKG